MNFRLPRSAWIIVPLALLFMTVALNLFVLEFVALVLHTLFGALAGVFDRAGLCLASLWDDIFRSSGAEKTP